MGVMGMVRKGVDAAKAADSPATGSRTGDFAQGFKRQMGAVKDVFLAGSTRSIWGVLGTFAAFDVFLWFLSGDSMLLGPTIRTARGVVK